MTLGACSTAFDVLEETKADLRGKTAIVTGGASGIGAVTAEALAKAGARVIIACRRVEEGEKVAAQINAKKYNKGGGESENENQVVVRKLDLADLSSVSAFASRVSADEPRVDLLVNNAGVMACPLAHTKDGFELQVGTCHHGHFALTKLLLPKLRETASLSSSSETKSPTPKKKTTVPSRVVTVASLAHRSGGLDPDDLHWEKRPYGRVTAYGAAKLANVLFARELAKREGGGGGAAGKGRGRAGAGAAGDNGDANGDDETKILSYSLHPGVIHTPLFRHVVGEGYVASLVNPAMDWFGWGVRGVLTRVLGFPGVKTVEQGAATTVFAAVAPPEQIGGKNGCYLADCKAAETTPAGRDDELAGRLWEVTEREVDAAFAKRAER